VTLEGVFGETGRVVAVESIVPWTGGTPVTSLIDELRAAGLDPVVFGDALRPRRALQATQEAKQFIDPLIRADHAPVPGSYA
jgi:hypothetical protein